MEGGENILSVICEDENLEDFEDVEMLDVEEGELLEHDSSTSQTNLEQSHSEDVNVANVESQSKSCPANTKNKKKKKKKKRSGVGQKFTDINRFVSDVCKHLKERKSYMVYTAVGCLGVSALSDLIKEVDAIQACGGQMTADGRRSRTGGGILWNIIKAREPSAYKEIMKKTKEFEKQFRQQNNRQAVEQTKEDSFGRADFALTNEISPSIPDGTKIAPQQEKSSVEGTRKSVHDRIRVPVSYDELLGEDPRTESL